MKTTNSFVMMITRAVVGFALLMTLGIGSLLPTPAPRGPERAALRAVPSIQIADGTESNGGKGDKKKRWESHIA